MAVSKPKFAYSVDNLLEIVREHKREHVDRKYAFLKNQGNFIPTRHKTMQDNSKLYGELGSAYVTYQLLRAYIRRERGLKQASFDNLSEYFTRGLLVTSATGDWLGEKLGLKAWTCLRHIHVLETAGFIRTFRFKGRYTIRAWKHLILFGWYTTEYVDSKQKPIEFYFEDAITDPNETIAKIRKLKGRKQRVE